MKPVKAGVAFSFTIAFENLSDAELGALLWIVRIADDETYRLKLGMGKPFGLGAITIDHSITLDDRSQRYQQLFDEAAWQHASSAITPEQIQRCVESFTTHVIDHSGERDNGYTTISSIPRIQHLLAMLKWQPERFAQAEPRPWNEVVRYLEIERGADHAWSVGEKVKLQDTTINEYRLRPVLPTPLGVLGTRPQTPPPPPPRPPKNGDHWGKITGQEARHIWSVTLDGGYTITAYAISRDVKEKAQEQRRVRIRITPNRVAEILRVE